MCTVAVLPRLGGGYLLGHNRDESVARGRGIPPERFSGGERAFLAPRDPDGGGTWISVNDAGVSLCLLNATEVDPTRLPGEPRSRGLVAWDAADLSSIASIADRLSHASATLEHVRAFHLVVAEPGAEGHPPRVGRLRWDGIRAVWDHHDGPWLFASSSKDQSGVERERGASWRRYLAGAVHRDRDSLCAWLARHEPEMGPLAVCMHRPDARTVSRTLIEVSAEAAEMAYLDGAPCEAFVERRIRLRLRLG